MHNKFPQWLQSLSPGAWVILGLAALSSALIGFSSLPAKAPFSFWVFSYRHNDTYRPVVERWNADNPTARVDLVHLHLLALERRLLSAFVAGTPVANLIEVERRVASRAFFGPQELIGFHDLTEVLRNEGLMEDFNSPSLAPWTSRGRVYGIPHDVHPVLLAYRADIVEAAGIDMSAIETWDQLAETLRPLMVDRDGDGRPDRFILGGWPTHQGFVDSILRQANGSYFDDDGKIAFASENNARAIAKIVSWCAGPDRICTDAPDNSVSGHRLRLDGTVLCTIIPDWQTSQWNIENPGLEGKLKLMPLPAFEPGGRRTSVWGGTMLGITRTTEDFPTAWKLAKAIYLSPQIAETTFRGTGIISPARPLWSLPFYDEPDPYFSNQPMGRLFIEQAPNVPRRSSSPYEQMALEKASSAAVLLFAYAQKEGRYSVAELLPETRGILKRMEAEIASHMSRNVFLAE